jgi:hypothetical protein
MITDLAATSSGAGGTHRIGSDAVASTTGGTTIAAGTLFSQLESLRLGTRIDFSGVQTWADGFKLNNNTPPADLQSALSAVQVDLKSTTASHSGAHKVGYAPNGTTTTGTTIWDVIENDVMDSPTFTNGVTAVGGVLLQNGGLYFDRQNKSYREYHSTIGGDSDDTIGPVSATDQGYDIYRVPTLTGNHIWTFSNVAPSNVGTTRRKRVRVVKTNSSAFTLTVKRSGGTTLAIIAASNPGWAEFEWHAGSSDWVLSAWSPNVTVSYTADT